MPVNSSRFHKKIVAEFGEKMFTEYFVSFRKKCDENSEKKCTATDIESQTIFFADFGT